MTKIKLFNIPEPLFIGRSVVVFLSIVLSAVVGTALFVYLQVHAEGSIAYDSIVKTIVLNVILSVFVAFVSFWFFLTVLLHWFHLKK